MKKMIVDLLLDDKEYEKLKESCKRYEEKGWTADEQLVFQSAMDMMSNEYISQALEFLEVNSKGVPKNKEL